MIVAGKWSTVERTLILADYSDLSGSTFAKKKSLCKEKKTFAKKKNLCKEKKPLQRKEKPLQRKKTFAKKKNFSKSARNILSPDIKRPLN